MQDRFKFRAKLKNMDKWIYGAYLKMLPYQPNPVSADKPLERDYKHLIITEDSADWGMPRGIAAYEVIPETVGQCTGLKDKNGKLIYELDYVRYAKNKYKVKIDKFLGISLIDILTGNTIVMDDIVLFNCEVIGNEYESNTKI